MASCETRRSSQPSATTTRTTWGSTPRWRDPDPCRWATRWSALDRTVNGHEGSAPMCPADEQPLRIAFLAYRGKPHVGGQGVYTRHLTKALVDLGHHVEVLGGQPYPDLDDRVGLTKLASLEIYNDYFPGRVPGFWEIKSWPDALETVTYMAGSFPEPLAFSARAWENLRHRRHDFDLVHDNQCLGYGLLPLAKMMPTIVTLHHPITRDRALEMEHARNAYERFSKSRWYSFVKMQSRVARRMPRILVVSENSIKDIHDDMGVDYHRM